MATQYIMPRVPTEQAHMPYYAYQQQQQYHQQQPSAYAPSQISTAYQSPLPYNPSPLSPLGNPTTISPSNSKSYISRQIRPLFVPAVLRPTEFPSKEPPSRRKQPEDEEEQEDPPRPTSSLLSLGGLTALGRLSKRSTGDSAKNLAGNWDLEQFPKPTGAPTRKHWKPDHESTMCDHATCRRSFNYFTRRHHCRKCGNIFCDMHSSYEVPLDQDANFNPRGVMSRCCDHCYAEFKAFRARKGSYSSSTTQESSSPVDPNNARTTPSTPIAGSPTAANGLAGTGGVAAPAEVAQSVPRDWHWSTF